MNQLNDLACNENVVFQNLMSLMDIREKEIIEVGGYFPKDIVLSQGIKKWVSVDPQIPNEINEEQYVAFKGDILNFPCKEESFDIVFSSNAFQYISNFKQTMAYLHRLLRTGGKVFSHFGPIWSSPDGNNFENLILSDGKVINFWENNILPKWYHLLYSECELREIINKYFSSKDTDIIINFLFHSNNINRLFFNDYLEIFRSTGFKIILFKASDLLDYDLNPTIKNSFSDDEIKSQLTKMYGQNNYDCRDIMVLLEK